MNVLFVANDSDRLEVLLDIAEFTVERNHTNVTCVRRSSARVVALRDIYVDMKV